MIPFKGSPNEFNNFIIDKNTVIISDYSVNKKKTESVTFLPSKAK